MEKADDPLTWYGSQQGGSHPAILHLWGQRCTACERAKIRRWVISPLPYTQISDHCSLIIDPWPLIPNPLFSSQLPCFSSQFPVLSSPFSVHSSQFTVFSFQFTVVCSLIPVPCSLIPDPWSLIPGRYFSLFSPKILPKWLKFLKQTPQNIAILLLYIAKTKIYLL